MYIVHVHVAEYREQVQSHILHVHKYVHGIHICEIILFTDELAKSALQSIIVSLSFAISFMPYILCIIYMYIHVCTTVHVKEPLIVIAPFTRKYVRTCYCVWVAYI